MFPELAAALLVLGNHEMPAHATHALAARLVGMGRRKGESLIALLSEHYPMPGVEVVPAEVYDRCIKIDKCETLFTVVDEKVCMPDLFSADAFSPIPLTDDMHRVLVEHTELMRTTYTARAEHAVSSLLDKITRDA